MRTFRTIGIVGAVAALLLSATVVFAESKVGNSRQVTSISIEKANEKINNDYRAGAASSTERMKAAREEAKTRMQTQREKVTQRMADIQDKVKQEMAQKLAGQFENLNATWTDHFMKLLDRYDTILQKIQDRANIAAGNGKDIASTTAAIQLAKTAITSARAAVTAQAAKTYTPDISTIPTTATTTPSGQEKIMQGMRTMFQNLHNGLFKDLFALRDGAMKDARKAVQDALQTLKGISGVDDDKGNATSTEAKSNQ